MPHSPRTRRLGLETLERREMLAGNVSATVSLGQLTLTGNFEDNAIVLWRGPNPGQVVVAGAKDSAGGDTLVNGRTAPVTLSGVNRIYADLRSGQDRILITNLSLPVDQHHTRRAFYAEMGAGNDQIIISGNTGTPRNFQLNGGGAVPYGDVNIQGTVVMVGRDGDDVLSLVNASVGGLLLFGQAGNDSLYVDGSLAKNRIGMVRFDMGDGNDLLSLRRANISGGINVQRTVVDPDEDHSSRIDIFKVHAAFVNITLPDDTLRASISIDNDAGQRNIIPNVLIDLGGFNGATVDIRRLNSVLLRMNLTFLADSVSIVESFVNHAADTQGWDFGLEVRLSFGGDSLRLRDVTVNGSTLLDGGFGFDQLIDQGGNSLGNAVISSFEF
jgi:hypothetical protein